MSGKLAVNIDISVIVYANREGWQAWPALKSVHRALEKCQAYGYTFEIVIIHFCPDQETTAVYDKFLPDGSRRFFLEERDQLRLYRFGCDKARGDVLVFLHGGHLVDREFIVRSCRLAQQDPGRSVFLPRYRVSFGSRPGVVSFLSSDHPDFVPLWLCWEHYWNSEVFCVHRKLFSHKALDFQDEEGMSPVSLRHWHCRLLECGKKIIAVEDTAVFRRTVWNVRQPVGWNDAELDLPVSLFIPEGLMAAENRCVRKAGPEGMRAQLSAVHKRTLRKIVSLPRKLVAGNRQEHSGGAQEKEALPPWLAAEMKALNELEPQLVVPVDLHPEQRMGHDLLSDVYVDLIQRCGTNVSHVFLLPWLTVGGADLSAITTITVLAEQDLAGTIVVICTENRTSPWAGRLPENVLLIELKQWHGKLRPEQLDALVFRLLLQLRPQVIHTINSLLAYRLFIHKGHVLRVYSRLVAQVFCFDHLEDGSRSGVAVHCLADCFEHLHLLLSDNKAFLKEIQDLYGLDSGKMRVLYHPAPKANKPERKDDLCQSGCLNVVWASRIDRQKRPDLLLDIAEKCRDKSIHFHVYGSAVLDTDKYGSSFDARENVTYYGPFDGVAALPTERFDVFLYTSQWDGLPNVLLEAAASGLVLVCSGVGGIGELVRNRENGLLVSPFDDVDQYVAALLLLLEKPEMLGRMRRNMSRTINEDFSQDKFHQCLQALPEYTVAGHF